MKRIKQFLALAIMMATVLFAKAQINPADPLPLNPKVKTGRLANGITYYILPNAKPEKKVELRLILNSGSLSEDDNQLGLAHMCEHMAFNGTTHFKKNDIVSFLQDIGVGFGNDLNAYTSFDRTVYILPIPTDKPGNLEKGFQVLEDWAHNVTYNNDDIDGERAIILEESRLGKGAEDRMEQKWLPLYFNGSRYGDRLPIGKDSIIKSFPHDVIKKYYSDWYRPDLMAVAVVGDITATEAEAMIKKHFEGIKPKDNPRPLPPFDFPAYTKDAAAVVTDKEATSYTIQIAWPAMPSKSLITFADYRNLLVKTLFNSMINARFREITQKPNPPFLFATGTFDGFVRGYEQFALQASTGSDNPARAIDVLIQEIERVKQFGFTEPEMERAKKNLLSNYESAYKNRDKTESNQLIEEFINLYLDASASPGIENEFEYTKNILPGITLTDVNALTEKIKGDQKKFYSITGPDNATGFKLYSNEELIAAAEKAAKVKVTPYEEAAVAAELLPAKPKAGSVKSKTKDAVSGTTNLVLSNGVTVALKPTNFKDDEIIMSASRYGGTSNYELKDKYSAQYAGPAQAAQGYGSFTPSDLQKALSGKKISAGGFFTPTRDGYSGSSTKKDVESMFQLLYLKLTSQRKDTALFNAYVKKQKSQTAMALANPQSAFIDTLGKFLYNNNPFTPLGIPKPSDFDKIDADRAREIFKERLCDLTGMHFVFVGSFKEEEIIPLIETYIASLPASGKKTMYVDKKVGPIKGNRNFTYNTGKEQKSLLLQIFSGEVPYSEDAEMKANALTEAMNIRIIEEIREKAQAIYGGGIQGGLTKEPYSNYQLLAVLPTGPEKVDTALKTLKAEIKKMQDNGPTTELLDKVKKQWLEAHRESMKSNSEWANQLIAAKVEGNNIDRFINYEKYVNKLTPKDIQDAAKKYLNNANMVTAVQLPEAAPKAAPVNPGGRAVAVKETFEVSSADITVELYDNADVDGDQVTLYFNGNVVAQKQNLTDKPATIKLKAVKGENTLIMFADNLGTTPPNTAFMLIKAGGKEYKATISSDTNSSSAIKLILK